MNRKNFREEALRADIEMYKRKMMDAGRLVNNHGLINICEVDSNIFINVVLDLYNINRGYFNNNIAFINKQLLEYCLDDIERILYGNYLHEMQLKNIMSNVIFGLLEFNLLNTDYNNSIYMKLIRLCFRVNSIRAEDIINTCMLNNGYMDILRTIVEVYKLEYVPINYHGKYVVEGLKDKVVSEDDKVIDKEIIATVIRGINFYETIDASILLNIIELPIELLDDNDYQDLVYSCHNLSDVILSLDLYKDEHVVLMKRIVSILSDNTSYYRSRILDYASGNKNMKLRNISQYENDMKKVMREALNKINSLILPEEIIEQVLINATPSFDDYNSLVLVYRNFINECIHQTNMYFEYAFNKSNFVLKKKHRITSKKEVGYEDTILRLAINGREFDLISINLMVLDNSIIYSLLNDLNYGTVVDVITRYILLIEFTGFVSDDDIDKEKLNMLVKKIKDDVGGEL